MTSRGAYDRFDATVYETVLPVEHKEPEKKTMILIVDWESADAIYVVWAKHYQLPKQQQAPLRARGLENSTSGCPNQLVFYLMGEPDVFQWYLEDIQSENGPPVANRASLAPAQKRLPEIPLDELHLVIPCEESFEEIRSIYLEAERRVLARR
ncbi:hypothetical protein B9Z65_7222 [Elsinoe australis]|uniref:Uncharacterized protein n=1 Tax=Elsinoe australis TaxID=40998 RepID=A0A2P7Z666_9PEZI|nr:hypothetical protein B9Z65_7222 [Elsinoe australis]